MRYAGLVKIFLLIFLAIAVYNYKKSSIESKSKEITEKVSKTFSLLSADPVVITEDGSNNQPTLDVEEGSSYIERKIAGVISTVMKTPEGKEIVQGVLKTIDAQDEKTKNMLLNSFNVTEVVLGSGVESSCGNELEIDYSVSEVVDDKNATKPQSSSRQKATFIVGSSVLPDSLERGILGMKKGGNRKILFSKSKIPFTKNDPIYLADVTLVDIHEPTPLISKSKIFTKNIDQKTNSTRKFNCGQLVLVDYEIRDIKDNIIYDSKKAKGGTKPIKIGGAQIPQEISATMDNLPVGDRIFITIPSKDLVNMKFLELPSDLKISEEIVVLTLQPHF
jgi:FKBP-type peptidyl-prolyl cis-trans isomerase 2